MLPNRRATHYEERSWWEASEALSTARADGRPGGSQRPPQGHAPPMRCRRGHHSSHGMRQNLAPGAPRTSLRGTSVLEHAWPPLE